MTTKVTIRRHAGSSAPRISVAPRISAAIVALLAATSPIAAVAQQPVYPVTVPNTADPLLTGLAIPADAATAGMWSRPIDWPIIAIHSSVLPDGRILTFGAAPGGVDQDGRTLVFWDPRKGVGAAALLVSPNVQNVDSFCASATLLSDGKLLTSGGASYSTNFSSLESMVLDWKTSTAARDYNLNAPRWYGTMTKLPDGRAVITGGGVPYAPGDPNRKDAAPEVSSTPEVYTPGQGWRSLVGAYSTDAFGAKNTRWWYPRQWVSPSGSLFGISTEKMWEMRLDGNGTIRTLRDFKTPANATTRPNVGPTSTAVMYDTGRILQVGGNGYYNGYGTPSSAAATIFDINGLATGRVTTTETAAMANPRQWANAVVLPNGRVLVTGGSRFADQAGGNAVLAAETWDPATGRWTTGSSGAIYRGYHSTATLLPDGAVLVAGGGAPGPVVNRNAEIYYPSYLFRREGAGAVLAARPRIVSLSTATAGFAQAVDLQVATGDEVAEVSLIAVASVTHSFDSNQRRMKLAFERTANGVRIVTPASGNLAPPGYYLLSIVNAGGVPSTGAMIALGAAPPLAVPAQPGQVPPQGVRTLVPDTSIRFEPVARPANLIRHANFVATMTPVTSTSNALDRADSAFIVRPGRGDPRCYSFEASNFPGMFLQHDNFRILLKGGDNGAVATRGQTFCARAALNGSNNANDISLESLDWPGFFVGLAGNDVSIVKNDGTAAAAQNLSLRTGSAGLLRNTVASLRPATWPDHLWRRAGTVANISQVGAASTAADKRDVAFAVREGLADKACVSFESVNNPGYFLRHQNFQMRVILNDASANASKDATFCVRPAPNGATDIGTVSLEALSWPGYFIRHQNFGLFIMRNDESAASKTDGSFVVVAPPQ